jgi:hypothetical protein
VESLGYEELALMASQFTWYTTTTKIDDMAGQRMDASNAATLATSSPVASRRASRRLSLATTTLVGARTSGNTPLASISLGGRFDNKALNNKYLQKAKIKEHAFLASLSDLDHDSDESASSSSDEELKRCVKDKLNGLCFITDITGGLCTMALDDNAVGGDGKDIDGNSASEVSHFTDDLTADIEKLNVALGNQDRLLRLAARERKEFKSKYGNTLRELESTRSLVVMSDETICDGCVLHLLNLATL